MKPHRSIFAAALQQVGVTARMPIPTAPAMSAGTLSPTITASRAVLVSRSGPSAHLDACPTDVPRIQSLRELPALL